MRLNPKLKEDLKRYLAEKIGSDRKKVIVYSSVKLTREEKNLLAGKLPEISFDVAEYKIDDSLIAGVKVAAGSKIVDLSLKGALLNFKSIIYESD